MYHTVWPPHSPQGLDLLASEHDQRLILILLSYFQPLEIHMTKVGGHQREGCGLTGDLQWPG